MIARSSSKLRLTLAAVAAVALAVGSTAAVAATKTIAIGDNWFVKNTDTTQTVRITAGSTIRWKWVGSDAHNVRVRTAPAGVSRSKLRISARRTGTVRRTLRVPGTYKFYCSIHDGYDPQRVTVKVRARS